MTLYELEQQKKRLIFMERNYRSKGQWVDANWVAKSLRRIEEEIAEKKAELNEVE